MLFSGTPRFRPLRLLGTGGTGSVYLVHDEHLGNEVALKTLALSGGRDLYRFKREFRALADVDHPNLVSLYELISDTGAWFFTMEYVNGQPFDRYLLSRQSALDAALGVVLERTYHTPPIDLDTRRLLRSLQQLCAGVHAMHEIGYVHRDLKPSNVLVTPSGRVVILDFGLSQQAGITTSLSDGMSGTPAYMAPEQALDRPSLPGADWYAVGAMLYEVLTGRCPFEGTMVEVLTRKQREDPPPPRQLNPHADELLSELCLRLLHRDERQRPTGQELLVRLGVASERPAPPPRKRHRRPRTAPWQAHGREPELGALSRALARSRKGRLAVVAVQGSSGIGKTRLVETFLENLEGEAEGPSSPLVLRGRCHERETLPFKALDDVVDGLSTRLARLSVDDQAYVLPDGILYLSEVFPVLRRLRLTDCRRYLRPPLCDASELRNQAFVAFCELLRRLARLRPVVLFIDDLQWADRDSFALLRVLTQQPGAPPVLLVVAMRKAPDGAAVEGLLHELAEHDGVEPIVLGPLAPDHTHELVTQLLDADDIAEATQRHIAAAVVRESGGNPFFAIELVHHLRTRVLPQGVRELQLDVGGFSLDRMIIERVASLPAESQALLRIVAVAGDPLPQQVLAAAAGLAIGTDAWERGITALLDQCLIRRSGRQHDDLIEPYHDRIREAIAGSLDEAASCRIHVGLAQAIQSWDPERTDLLARYWLVAADHARAKHYTCAAAAEARAKLAFERAAELYQGAVELEEDAHARAALLQQAGECWASGGCAVKAAEAYQGAAQLCAPEHSARLLHLAAEQLLRGGMIANGLAVLQRVLAQAGLRLAPSARSAALSVFLRTLWLRLRGLGFREHPEPDIAPADKRRLDILWSANTGLGAVDALRADDFLLRFLLLALKTGDVRRVAQGLAVLSLQLAAFGRRFFDWALRMAREADVLARRSGDAPTIGLARMCRGVIRYLIGDYTAADELTEVETFILSHCHGMSWELANARLFTCFSLHLSGRLRELCERFDRYTADADRTGDRYLATNLRTYLSVVWLIRDDLGRAAKDIEGTLDVWPADMYHVQHFLHLYARCEQALYAGQPATAWEALVAEQGALARSGLLNLSVIGFLNAWARGRIALALAEQAEPAARRRWLAEARRNARLLHKPNTQARVAICTAVEAGITRLTPGSDPSRVILALSRAVATAESAGALLIAESLRRWLGELIGGRQGAELLAHSHAWMAEQGVRNPGRLAYLYAPGFRTPEQSRQATSGPSATPVAEARP